MSVLSLSLCLLSSTSSLYCHSQIQVSIRSLFWLFLLKKITDYTIVKSFCAGHQSLQKTLSTHLLTTPIVRFPSHSDGRIHISSGPLFLRRLMPSSHLTDYWGDSELACLCAVCKTSRSDRRPDSVLTSNRSSARFSC